MSDDGHGTPPEVAEAGHDRGVVGGLAVAVQLDEVGHEGGHVVERVRPRRVAGDQGLLPRGEARVDLARNPVQLFAQFLDLAPVSGVVGQGRELLDPPSQPQDRLLEMAVLAVHWVDCSRPGPSPISDGYIRSCGSTSTAIWTPAGGRPGTLRLEGREDSPAVAGAQEDLEAPPALEPLEGRGRGSRDAQIAPSRRAQGRSDLRGGGFGSLPARRGHEDRGELAEGRVEERPPESELFPLEGLGVVPRGERDRRMPRMKRLDVHGSRRRAAAGPSRHLGEQLEGLLGRAEIREVQQRVRREDADRSDVREVVALRDHLRSDEARRAARLKIFDDGGGAAAPRGIAVEHDGRHAGEELSESLGDTLGAGPDRLEQPAPALRTARRAGDALAAVVADQAAAPVVHRARDAALRASEVVAAVAAQEERREAPSGLEEDRLLAAGEDVPEPFHERTREERHTFLFGKRGLAAEIHDLHFGKGPRSDPLRKDQPGHAPDIGRVEGLGRGRRRAEDESRRVLLRPQGHDLAGVVARRLALLVGGVVLLVDDEESRDPRPARTRPSAGRSRRGPPPSARDPRRRRARVPRGPSGAPRRVPGTGGGAHGRTRASGRSRGRARSPRGRPRAWRGWSGGRPRSFRCRSRPEGGPGGSGAPGWRP